MSLKKKTVSSLKWTLLERFSGRVLAFAIQVILAWLLLPEDFGIVATVAIILVIASVLTEGGMGAALIQKKDIDRIDISTVFFLNIFISLTILVVLTFASPLVANFFEEPILRYLLPVLAIGVFLSAFGQTQLQMLNRNLEFKRLFSISIPALVISGITGIAMALTGFGVWALVGQRLTRSFVMSSCAWAYCNPEWRPRAEFSLASLKKISGFSLSMLSVNLLYKTAQNIHGLVIAKAFSMSDLGFYNRAQSFQKQPVMGLTAALQKVFFPVFSRIQNDNQRIRSALRKGIPLMAFIVMPAMIWLIAVAEPLVIVVLGQKWLPSVPYLQVVPLFGCIFPLAALKMNVITGKGKSRLILMLGIFKQSLQLVVLFFTWRYGIMVMILGQLASGAFNMLLNDVVIARLIDYPLRKQVFDWMPSFVGALIALAACLPLQYFIQTSPPIELLLRSALFVAVYLLYGAIIRLDGMALIGKLTDYFAKGSPVSLLD